MASIRPHLQKRENLQYWFRSHLVFQLKTAISGISSRLAAGRRRAKVGFWENFLIFRNHLISSVGSGVRRSRGSSAARCTTGAECGVPVRPPMRQRIQRAHGRLPCRTQAPNDEPSRGSRSANRIPPRPLSRRRTAEPPARPEPDPALPLR